MVSSRLITGKYNMYKYILVCHYLSRQDNDQSREYISQCRRTKALAANVIAIAIMITVMTTLTSISEHSVNAQMMGDHGNITSGVKDHQQKMIINGTINLEQTIFQAIDSKIN